MTIQMKANEQYFPLWLLIMKLQHGSDIFLISLWMKLIVKCDHPNESYVPFSVTRDQALPLSLITLEKKKPDRRLHSQQHFFVMLLNKYCLKSEQ